MKLTNLQANQAKISLHWDCQNVPINNPFLARYLLNFSDSRGRLVTKNAYANWRKEKRNFEQRLHEIDYDCIDVPITAINSLDQKLKANCKREIERDPSIDIVILVTGDGDFAPLVKELKAKGKKVIIFAQSRNASKSLIQLADEFYFVDKLPELVVEAPQVTTISYSEASFCLIEAVKTTINRGKSPTLEYVSNLMRDNKHFPNYQGVASIRTQNGKTFPQFKKFVAAVVKDGNIGMKTEGNSQELFLIELDIKVA